MQDPKVELLFCPTQTDFLTFMQEGGFAAVELNLIEGFMADNSEDKIRTQIHLASHYYTSTETVPVLVARYAYVKKLRYAKEREEYEVMKSNILVTGPITSDAMQIGKVPKDIASPPSINPEAANIIGSTMGAANTLNATEKKPASFGGFTFQKKPESK